jgi:hypothetical protein
LDYSPTYLSQGAPANYLDGDKSESLLVTSREGEVDADTAVLATVRDTTARSNSNDVFVESNVENSFGRIDVNKGVTNRAARTNSSDIDNLDVGCHDWDRRRDENVGGHGSGGAGKQKRPENHLGIEFRQGI